MILIARAQLKEIMDAAEQAYPRECCGLLVGHGRPAGEIEVVRVARSENFGKARDRFEIDPRLWVDLTRALRGSPQRVVGLYHSHPDRAAQPSAVDLEAAWAEELIWLIVAVEAGQAVHVSAHVLDHGGRQFRRLELRTTDWAPWPIRPDPAPETT
jgi:proteasome lid subunit RPN8/RPN11